MVGEGGGEREGESQNVSTKWVNVAVRVGKRGLVGCFFRIMDWLMVLWLMELMEQDPGRLGQKFKEELLKYSLFLPKGA